MISWLSRQPLALFLSLQALVTCWNLGMLSPWGDEAGTLLMVRGPLGTLVRWAAEDVHPPLYYSLLYCWQRLPLGLDWAIQARLLSVVFALLATIALDRLWARHIGERARWVLLALWTLSPCLLLYARMCRSYTLQALCAIVAVAFLVRVVGKFSARDAAFLTLAVLAALYTHYVAGIALVATANLVLLRRRSWRTALGIDLLLAVGYSPWLPTLLASLAAWGRNGRNYNLTGSRFAEVPVKFAYWAMSFTMGEAVPDAVLVLGVLMLPLIAWAVWKGARGTSSVAWAAGTLAAIGFFGVARWVSYPFVPARMLFVLPFFLLLVARAVEVSPRWGRLAAAAMLLLSISGVISYFGKAGFRNKEYPIPIREIAERILRESNADDSVVLVDSTNSDPIAMLYALHPRRAVLQTAALEASGEMERILYKPEIHTVWFLRNTHDVSADRWNDRLRARLRTQMKESVQAFEPYTPLERWLMQRLGGGSRDYFQELLEYQR